MALASVEYIDIMKTLDNKAFIRWEDTEDADFYTVYRLMAEAYDQDIIENFESYYPDAIGVTTKNWFLDDTNIDLENSFYYYGIIGNARI